MTCDELGDGSLTGEFACREIRVGAPPNTVMSTVRNGEVAPGTFNFDNCEYY